MIGIILATSLLVAPAFEEQTKLAIAASRDQEQEKAFDIFLQALNQKQEPSVASEISQDEQLLYEQFLRLYWDSHATTRDISLQIKRESTSILAQHPEYHLIRYALALADANLENFPEFLENFAIAFQKDPEHYLAYKTKAVLYLKLFMRARTLPKREELRIAMLQELKKALVLEPRDPSLYKLLIKFSADEEKQDAFGMLMKFPSLSGQTFSRKDLIFYVEQALQYKQPAIAQQLIDVAGESYPNSRLIKQLQENIDEHALRSYE